MEIIKGSREFTKQELYKLTHNKSTSLKDLMDEKLNVLDWLYYKDVNARGVIVEILALVTDTGLCTTISSTFIKEFFDIMESFGLPVEINVIGGKSKSGRVFITCELA